MKLGRRRPLGVGFAPAGANGVEIDLFEVRRQLVDRVCRKARRAGRPGMADDLGLSSCVRAISVRVLGYRGVLARRRRHLRERGHEPPPVLALFRQHRAAGVGDAVIAPPPLAGLFHPASLDPAAILHPVERGVEGGQREPQVAVRSLFDQLGNLVAVMRFVLDHRQDQDLGAAFLGLVDRSALRHAGSLYEGQLYVRGCDEGRGERKVGAGGTGSQQRSNEANEVRRSRLSRRRIPISILRLSPLTPLLRV